MIGSQIEKPSPVKGNFIAIVHKKGQREAYSTPVHLFGQFVRGNDILRFEEPEAGIEMASSQLSKSELEQIQHIISIPENIEPVLWPGCCIYKVPENIRCGNPGAYTPQLISIGPLHYNQENPKPLQTQKQIYFKFFWKRLSEKQQALLEDYKSYLSTKQEEIRHCYSEKFPLISKDEFVDIILLDSVFIVELFLRQTEKLEDKDDYILTKSWLNTGIMRDLLLLENQIPIFVLKELYNRVAPGFSILSLAREYFRDYDVQIQPSDDDNIVVRIDWQLSKHFTDLIRYLHIPLDFEYESKPDSAVLKSATKLREAGVSFQAVSNKFLLDIKFEEKPQKACFLLTQFRIQTGTERVLRNVMALEQCHYPDQTYICNYVSLLDDLVDIEADVDLLVENQIMVNELGSNREMATLVNSLCRELVINSNCYAQLIDQLNQHYDSYFNRTMATLKNVYFSDLWRGSSTVVGLAVLMFTFYNFFHPFFVKDDLNKPKLGLFNM